jgi:hypothetical protein
MMQSSGLRGRLELKHSTDRILTTHVGRLPFPPNQAEIMQARRNGDKETFERLTMAAIGV